MVRFRSAVAMVIFSLCAAPAFAQGAPDVCALHVDVSPVAAGAVDMRGGAAPADVDFGTYPMSVLGIQNVLRRDGEAIDDASDRSALTTGPLACVVDAIRDWERAYPADPWIAKDLLTLEMVYLRARGPEARALARSTEVWLAHDYPSSNYLEPARLALGGGHRAEDCDVRARARAGTAFGSRREPAAGRRAQASTVRGTADRAGRDRRSRASRRAGRLSRDDLRRVALGPLRTAGIGPPLAHPPRRPADEKRPDARAPGLRSFGSF